MSKQAHKVPKIVNLAAGVPICGFVGRNGAGKTLLAVNSAIADLARGRTVLSTVPIESEHGSSVPLTSLRQFLEVQDTTILLDDVSVIFSARSTQSLPPEVVSAFHTVRHRRNTVLWTAPQWVRADTNIRGVTQAVVVVKGMWKRRVPDDPWPQPRLVFAALMDTSDGKADSEPTTIMRRRLVRPRKLPSFGAYDTHADTPMLGVHAVSVGVCPDCGGSRPRPKHDQERHEKLGLPWYDEEYLGAGGAASVQEPGVALTFHESEAAGV